MLNMRPATLDDTGAVADLLAECAAADGFDALSEFKALRVPVANWARSLVATDDGGDLVALAVAAWHPQDIGETDGYWAAEMALRPGLRSADAYESLLAALESDLDRPPALWTFAPEQVAAAVAHGMAEARTLVEMRRPLPAPAGEFPAGFRVRGFVPGADEDEWLALNQEVFAHHPEAGSIDAADLALRMAQPWFDGPGLLLVYDNSTPIGYCWTKVHPGGVGEIYMVGLVPAYRRRRLARPLTLLGLDYLAQRGATTGMLYAEESNRAALELYGGIGFEVVRRISLYEAARTA